MAKDQSSLQTELLKLKLKTPEELAMLYAVIYSGGVSAYNRRSPSISFMEYLELVRKELHKKAGNNNLRLIKQARETLQLVDP